MTHRETTVRWNDPAPALTALPALSGIDFMRKMVAGELSGAPMASHFAMDVVDVESGAVTFR